MNVDSRYSATSLHSILNIEWLDVSRKQSTVCELYKILSGQCPSNLKDIFKEREITRTLRSNVCTQIVRPVTRTVAAERDLAVRAVKYWEAVPPDVRVLPNIDQFKRAVKSSNVFLHE